MPKLVVLLAILISSFIQLNAQHLDPSKELSQYNIDHWNDERSPSSILEIIQTTDGYIWMVTLKGLVRFDGVRITRYDKFSNPELVNGFKSIFEDSQRRLWFGSIGGGAFIKSGNNFQQVLLPYGPSSNNIEQITEDADKTLWFCTLKGLISYKDSVFTLFTPANAPESGDFPVYDVIEDRNKNTWVATAHGLMTLSDGKLIPQENAGFGKVGEVIDMHLGSDQTLWLASYSSGVFTYRDEKLQRVVDLDPQKHPMTIYEDHNKNIWIGSERGVARYTTDGRISRLGSSNGLSHDNVSAISEDHEGSVWLGTYYGGINRLRDGTFTNYTTIQGIPHNTVHCIFQSKDSTLWIGAEKDIAYKKQSLITKLSNRYPELRNARVRGIREDSKGNLWIASYDGLFVVKNNTIKKFNVADGLSSDQTRMVYEDSKGAIWVGTRQGLNKRDGDGWIRYSPKDGLLNDFIMSIIERKDGTLLIGTTGGVFAMSGDQFQPFSVNGKSLETVTFDIYEDNEGRLWAGTANGLTVIQSDSIHEFNKDPQLGRNIYQILEDDDDAFWLSTDEGIVRVLKTELLHSLSSGSSIVNTRLFDKSSGLRTNEITPTGRGVKTFDGKLWFPTLDGISCVDPKNIIVNTTPPPINIEKVLISGKEYDWTTQIHAPSNSRNIEIHYTGLSYMIPKKVKFKYKLEGFDKDWIDAGERRTAYYSALPPGDYTFSIKASNNDGIWSTSENILSLHVERAFWQTIPFYLFSLMILALLVIGIIHARTRNVKRLNVKLEEKIHERTQEVIQQKEEIESQRDYIETKNHELEKARMLIEQQYEKLREINENLEAKVEDRTRELKVAYEELIAVNKELDDFVYKSAHDIKGPLARLQGLCNLALMEAGKLPTREYLLKLQKESLLANRVIEKLAHTYEVKHHSLTLVDIPLTDMVSDVVKMIRTSYPEETAHTLFDIRIPSDLELRTDKRLLSEVLFNLLENAVIFKTDVDPKVIIHADEKNDRYELVIGDNGIGMDAKVRSEIFNMFVKGNEKSQGLGLGLYIAKMAVEVLGGTITLMDSELGETKFKIELPSGDVFAADPTGQQKQAVRYSLD